MVSIVKTIKYVLKYTVNIPCPYCIFFSMSTVHIACFVCITIRLLAGLISFVKIYRFVYKFSISNCFLFGILYGGWDI